ncbi:hypothetical protein CN980_02315 [Bacillus cereus]|uniref:Uncharacterized protein n=1 Tax=Bacillus cereus TaxID=1396 RepID=A0A9X7GS63_BACCE|nr:hypothetical protein [Bacillus cereus]PGO80908.1 hypothetical protein CN980_02315 [Bacillus cereus]
MLIEIIPLGENREIVCGPPNFTKAIDMTPNSIYVFICQDTSDLLGTFACSSINLASSIAIERTPSGLKVVLNCL